MFLPIIHCAGFVRFSMAFLPACVIGKVIEKRELFIVGTRRCQRQCASSRKLYVEHGARQTKDHQNWELLSKCAEKAKATRRRH